MAVISDDPAAVMRDVFTVYVRGYNDMVVK
jgi:hypothetical protein